MPQALKYYGRLVCVALTGWLSTTRSVLFVVLSLALPCAAWFMGPALGLEESERFFVTVVTLSVVLVGRLALSPYLLYREDQKRLSDSLVELASFKDRNAMADVLVGVRESAIVRLNELIDNQNADDRWCREHLPWVRESKKLIEEKVSRADAHAIFDIGDASTLPSEGTPPKVFGSFSARALQAAFPPTERGSGYFVSEDRLDKRRYLRHYTKTLLDAINRYRG